MTNLTATAPPTASINQNFTIKGQLTANGAGDGSRMIALERSLDNKTFTPLTTKQANSTGWYTFSKNETAAGTYYYRATYAGNSALTNATSNVVKVTVTESVHATTTTLSASPTTTPAVGQSVTSTATLKSGTTALSGKPVTIYHYFNGVKYTDTTKTANSAGQIALTQSFSSTGQRTYYATFAGDSDYQTSTSSVLTINVH